MKPEVFGINVPNGLEISREISYFSHLTDTEENVYIVEELTYFFPMR